MTDERTSHDAVMAADPVPASHAEANRVVLTVDNNIAELRLNRPEKLNALDLQTFEQLSAMIARLREARDVRVVILHGAGRAFCAGLDVAAIREGGLRIDQSSRTDEGANLVQQAGWGWRTLPVPVIAAVHGVAYGGGFQIIAGADIRIGSPDVRLAIREIYWGLVPDMAGMALWRGCVRDDVLRELMMTGREVSGIEAQNAGLLTSLTDDPLAQARALAASIAQHSPDAIRAAKRLANLAASGASARDLMLAESAAQQALKRGANQREAVQAYMQRRAPLFTD